MPSEGVGGAAYCILFPVSATECLFVSNEAKSTYQRGFGGGLHLEAGGTVVASVFQGNMASSQFSTSYGGGLSSNAALKLSGQSVVLGNHLSGSGTAAVLLPLVLT